MTPKSWGQAQVDSIPISVYGRVEWVWSPPHLNIEGTWLALSGQPLTCLGLSLLSLTFHRPSLSQMSW